MADDIILTKPLEKMTVKDLRAMALKIPGITGVHAMKKDELIAEIKEAKGITDEPGQKVAAEYVQTLKKKIRDLRAKKVDAHESGDKKTIKILQRKINRLKKKTRTAVA